MSDFILSCSTATIYVLVSANAIDNGEHSVLSTYITSIASPNASATLLSIAG